MEHRALFTVARADLYLRTANSVSCIFGGIIYSVVIYYRLSVKVNEIRNIDMSAKIAGKILIDITGQLIIVCSEVCLSMSTLLESVSSYTIINAIAQNSSEIIIRLVFDLCKVYDINYRSLICCLIKIIVLIIAYLKAFDNIALSNNREVVLLNDIIYRGSAGSFDKCCRESLLIAAYALISLDSSVIVKPV